MTTSPRSFLAPLFILFVGGGCAQRQPAISSTTPTSAVVERPIYRLDFVLTTNDDSGVLTDLPFTLNLQELQKGEVTVGKNVLLPSAPINSTSSAAGPRQDVGWKVVADFRKVGEDLVLEVSVGVSTVDPPSTIRKVLAKGNALASPGRTALVTMLDDNHKRYQLTVKPTKLR